MKKLLLLLLFFSACIHNYGQTPDIKFDHIGVKDGLPEPQVHNILQDTEGYIWIGTQNGLVRYDGYTYKIYRLGSAQHQRLLNTYYVESIFEDNDKILWVTTFFNGLFRYDRSSGTFQQFVYPKELDGLEIAAEDSRKIIWGIYYSDRDGMGITGFNSITGKFELFNNKSKGADRINAKKFYKIYQSKNGELWIATTNGLYRYNGEGKGFKGFFTTNDTAKTLAFSPIYEAPSEPGILWANTYHGNNVNLKLTRFDYRNNTLKNYFPGKKPGELMNAHISSIYEDKKGRLWLALDSGLSKLDRKTGLFTNYLKKDTAKSSFSDIIETPKGNFWVTGTLGLVYFNTTTGEFKLYADDDAPNYIYHKIIDNTGQLWIGGKGVYKTNYLKSAFHLIKNTPGKVTGYPGGGSVIAPADSGDYWVFAASSIYKWKPATGEFRKILKTNINSSECNSICQGDKGVVYLGTFEGLRAYNTLTKKEEVLTNTSADTGFIKKASLFVVYRDHSGIIWLGSYHRGIASFDPKTKKVTMYPFKKGNGFGDNHEDGKLDDWTVLSIYEDRENTFWVGTNFGGLNRFDRATGKFYSYHTIRNQNMYAVNYMHEDRLGRMWVGTYLNGLFEFDKKNGSIIKSINEDSGLIHNEIITINEDTTGHLLLLTERGITRYDPVTGKIQNFNVNTIFPGEDISANKFPAAPRFAGNSMAFSLNDGLVEFNPQALAPNTTVPIVHITGITYSDPLSGTSAISIIPYGINKLELAYDQNRITFDYIGLHFDNPYQNQYAYKLDGYDKNWVNAGTLRNVTYTNLSPGTYTFHVRASNADGIWNNTGASITIIIHTSLWMRWWAWLIYIVLFAAAIYGFITYRSLALKRENQILEEKINIRTEELSHANKELSEQQEEITTQRDRLAETVNELKTTQKQLVQSEKLASLGELTAGIAHEIQNPLNFVNNFSEVSVELIDEMQSELKNGDKEEAIAISEDIKQNLEKIRHHGKRADGIVKNMLQHSRNNSGEKELTDINNLADEYLRLSYHGLRAKDKSFNSDMETGLAEKLPKIDIIPQEIGRVMLNLYNNAFYAVQQKKKTAGADYKPLVKVSTALKGKSIEITVTDNGTGMPAAVKEKILQPFFTTKPTGEGTGLGLSLSYDIVVKSHGGNIAINSTEGQGSEFIVTLPLNNV